MIYQVYPRSFADSNQDGVGDLQGVKQHLGYLKWLGVSAVWLSPIFKSPMRDGGYDVSDYMKVDSLFGSMKDLEDLITEAHALGLKVILDFVPNHTSSEHEWFIHARASRDNDFRNWYIWRDPAPDGGPPNDMKACFGGPAWTLDEHTGQYYYHSFLAEQPDLDWSNSNVRDAMLEVERFWLKRVDGLRIDVIQLLSKDEDAFGYESLGNRNNAFSHGDGPKMEEYLALLRKTADEFEDRLLIGEVFGTPRKLLRYYGPNLNDGVHLPFNFSLLNTPWTSSNIIRNIVEYENTLPSGAWPNWVLGNHDTSRICSRIGSKQARVAAMLLLTLRGTPTIYQGDELGLTDGLVGRRIDVAGRDKCRTPLPWDTSLFAGFSTVAPWLPLNLDAECVSIQKENPNSILNLYRQLLDLRKARSELAVGKLIHVPVSQEGVVMFDRVASCRVRIVLNLCDEEKLVEFEGNWKCLLDAYLDGWHSRNSIEKCILLRANDGVVLEEFL